MSFVQIRVVSITTINTAQEINLRDQYVTLSPFKHKICLFIFKVTHLSTKLMI